MAMETDCVPEELSGFVSLWGDRLSEAIWASMEYGPHNNTAINHIPWLKCR